MTSARHPNPPRIVVENSDEEAGLAQVAALEDAGYRVTHCPGPSSLPSGLCPAVDGTGCALVGEADAILFDLDFDDPYSREVLIRLRHSYPEVPVVVEVPADVAREESSLLRGCHVVTPYDMERLVRAVGHAVDEPAPATTGLHPTVI